MLVLSKTEEDFQQLPANSVHEFTIDVTNTGHKPILPNVQASCGCTTPALSAEVIEPGRTEVIRAKFDTTGRKGPQRKNIYVTYNSETGPQKLTYTFKAFV